MNIENNKYFSFKNKVVLITGSNGIIGNELCNFFLELGAIVFGIDNKKKTLKNPRYIHLKGSVTNENFVFKKLSMIIKKESKIDIILNCAAISIFSHFEKRTKKEKIKL